MNDERLDLAELTPSEYNPRQIQPDAMARLKTLLREHTAAVEGWDPADGVRLATTITVNRQGMRIVGGHQRVKALQEMGQTWVHAQDVTWVDLEPGSAREKALNVALNSQDAAGDWQWEALAQVVQDVNGSDIDLALTGLADDVIESMLRGIELGDGEKEPGGGTEPPENPADELQRKWGTEAGQLWQCGEHRIVCGDCTDPEVVARVMGGEKAALCLTDPPYGIGFKYDGYSDDREAWFGLMDRFVPQYRAMVPFMIMPSCGIDRLDFWYTKHRPDWLMCWYKGSPGHLSKIGFNDWEAHLVWGKPPKQMHDYWQTACGFEVDGHPCPKPVVYAEWLVERGAEVGRTVVDPFLGSGTTMIACERLGRKCRGIEVSAAYVAVCLERWHQETGLTPVRVIEPRS